MGQGSSQFPYELGEELRVHSASGAQWTLHAGRSKAGEAVTIFTMHKSSVTASRWESARNYMQRLKTLRHPNLLQYVDAVELPETLHLVTESVTPVDMAAVELEDESLQCLVLQQLVSAIAFLNDKCGMVHGNVCPASIFQTRSGEWKLGGFDVTYKFADGAGPTSRQNADVLPSRYRAPELLKRNWSAITSGPVWACDAWGLACVIYELFHKQYHSPDQLGSPSKVPRALLPAYKKLLAGSPSARLSTAKALSSRYFDNPLVKLVQFIDELPLKGEEEKRAFFAELGGHMQNVPTSLLRYKVLPELTKSLEFGSASVAFTSVLGAILHIGASLETAEFEQLVVPSIVRLFSAPSRAVRMSLLQNLDAYAPHLSSSVITDNIWPHVLNGFTDTFPQLRELSLKCLVHFVPKLPESTVDGQVMKIMAKLQTDQVQSIRTNTTYCLGKVAPHLSAATRKKVLASAFTRALRDPFPPARVAGLAAIEACAELFDRDEVAHRILPVIVPHCVDAHADVRKQCIRSVNRLVPLLAQFAAQMDEEDAKAAQAHMSGGDGGAGVAGGKGGAVSKTASVLGKVGSWAIGSLTKQIVGEDSPVAASRPQEQQQQQQWQAEPKQQQQQKKKEQERKPANGQPTSAMSLGSAKKAANDDGWGDDFFSDFGADEGEEEVAPVALLSTSKKPKGRTSRAKPKTKPAKRKPAVVVEQDDFFAEVEVEVGKDNAWGDDDIFGDLDDSMEVANKKTAVRSAKASDSPWGDDPFSHSGDVDPFTLGGGKAKKKAVGSAGEDDIWGDAVGHAADESTEQPAVVADADDVWGDSWGSPPKAKAKGKGKGKGKKRSGSSVSAVVQAVNVADDDDDDWGDFLND